MGDIENQWAVVSRRIPGQRQKWISYGRLFQCPGEEIWAETGVTAKSMVRGKGNASECFPFKLGKR